jgi:transcriptional regulator with XRE-family HTH domain
MDGGGVDREIGDRIATRRYQLLLSTAAVTDRVGVSEQRLVELERGDHRFSAIQLYELCRILSGTPAYFFARRGPPCLRLVQ